MRGHGEVRRAIGEAHHENVLNVFQAHARAKVSRPHPIEVDGCPLRVAALAHVELEFRRKLCRINDGVVDLPRYVHEVSGPLLLDMDRPGAVAPFAINPQGDVVIPVLRPFHKTWHGVVTGHTCLRDWPVEPFSIITTEARREIPLPRLGVPCYRDLIEIPILFPYVGVGVVAGPDDVVDLLDSLVEGVPAGHPVLHDEDLIAPVEGQVVEVVIGVIDRLGVHEVGVTVAQEPLPEGAPHFRLHKRLVLLSMAGPAGLTANVRRLRTVVEVGAVGWQRVGALPVPARAEYSHDHQSKSKTENLPHNMPRTIKAAPIYYNSASDSTAPPNSDQSAQITLRTGMAHPNTPRPLNLQRTQILSRRRTPTSCGGTACCTSCITQPTCIT